MIKNTLWVFGDSFSWDHKIRFKHWTNKNNPPSAENDVVYKYIQEHLDGEVFECWGEILANSLNLNYENHASFQSYFKSFKNELGTGPSVNSQINLIHEFSNKFKQGDIVIFGFSSALRFDYCVDANVPETIVPNHELLDSNPILGELMVNRSEYFYYLLNEVQKLKGIETLSDVVGFQLWYWDFPGDYTRMVVEKKIPGDRWIYYKLNPELPTFEQQLNDKQISNIGWETKGKVPDGHYGTLGNQEKARMLINFFKKHKI
tara:strand:- start:385 stop:1167 length:783 start_codon:yes stop_codon:yes gene_type:complete